MKELFKQRELFNEAYELRANKKFGFIKEKEAGLEYDMLQEELNEYVEACANYDKKEILDAIADITFVLIGTIVKHGIKEDHFKLLMREVFRSNMSKLHKGKVVKNEAGKVVKPDTFSPPNIEEIIKTIESDEKVDELGL